jgi:hypothetical protein
VLDWIRGHGALLIALGVLSVGTLVGSALLLPWIIVRAPTDYFTRNHAHVPWSDKHPAVRLILIAGKNVLGFMLVLAGILMLVLPGQGILTIIAGMALMDFPGRHEVVRRLAAQPPILRSMNWIRRRAGQAPLSVG